MYSPNLIPGYVNLNKDCIHKRKYIFENTIIIYFFGNNGMNVILRVRCGRLKSLTLSDGEYYEMVKSNFERADRTTTVRTTTNYTTSIVPILSNYRDLLFN